jgi:hypothetical protein
LAHRCVTVHDWQLDIHQNEVRPLLCYSGERLLAILSFGDYVVGRGQHIANDLTGIRLILDH